MELKEITITASYSKNYQKGEFTATATVESLQDIEELKELCRKNARDILESVLNTPVETQVSEPVNNGSELEDEKPQVRRVVQNAVSNNSAPTPQAPRAKKRPGDCKIGETYSFGGVIYKLCHSNSRNDTYWLIQDESRIDDVHPKYRKDGLQ